MKTKTDDPFDLSKMALDAKAIAELTPFQKTSAAKPKQRSRAKVEFVLLPYEQTLAAAGKVKSSAALAVVVELAHRVFKTHESEVGLNNSVLSSVGISHKAKLCALRELEAAGMVTVDWRKRKSPLVTISWAPPPGRVPRL
jgi:hypothetical protein